MARQLELGIRPAYKWGGKRRGAGRKKAKGRSAVAHRTRPFHDRREPVHVTWKLVRGLPSLRGTEMAGVIGRAIRATTRDPKKRKAGFRIIHFSIQPDHLHLIVEAPSKGVLVRGLQGLAIRLARRMNKEMISSGRVFAERYHARPLRSPREVRNGIVYVLQNHKHHQPSRSPIDECSSARWFNGWEQRLPEPDTPTPVSLPDTWLADRGWRRYGPIRFHEAPSSPGTD